MKGKRSVPNIVLAAVLLAALILPAAATVGAQATAYIVESGDGCDALMLVPGLFSQSLPDDFCRLAGTVPAGMTITFQGGWALATPAPRTGSAGLALVNEGVINVNGLSSSLELGYNGLGHLDNKGTINFTTPVAIASTGTVHNWPGATMTVTTGSFTNEGAVCNSGTATGIQIDACPPGTFDTQVPVLTGITPNAVPVNLATFPVIVLSGTNFGPASQVWLSIPGAGTGLASTSYADGQLTARISDSLLGTAATWQIWVANLDGGRSESLPLTVTTPLVVDSADSCDALNQVPGLIADGMITTGDGGTFGVCYLMGRVPAGTLVSFQGNLALGTRESEPGFPDLGFVNEGIIEVSGMAPMAGGPFGYEGNGQLDNKGAIFFATPAMNSGTGVIHNWPGAVMTFTSLDGSGAICNNGTMTGIGPVPGACPSGTFDVLAPVLTDVIPGSVMAGARDNVQMMLVGANLGPTSQVWFSIPEVGTFPIWTEYVDGQLTADVRAELLQAPLTFQVTVSNVAAGRSESLPFIVTPPYVVNSRDSCWALNQVDGVFVSAVSTGPVGGGQCTLAGTWPEDATLIFEDGWALRVYASAGSNQILANEGVIQVDGGYVQVTGDTPVSYLGYGHLDNYGTIEFTALAKNATNGAIHNHAGASINFGAGLNNTEGTVCNDGTIINGPDVVPACNFSDPTPPVLTAVTPATLAVVPDPYRPDVNVTLSGTGFGATSQAWWRGVGPSGSFQYPVWADYNPDDGTLTLSVPPVFLLTAQTVAISVQTPHAGTTEPWPFFITETGAATGGQAAGSGTNPTAALDGLDVSGTGEGSVVITDFQSVPVPAGTGMNLKRPFDVFVSPHNELSTLEIKVQVPASMAAASTDAAAAVTTPTIRWWNRTTRTWQVASTQTVIAEPASASAASTAGTRYTISLRLNTRTSSPLIGELTGTYFAVDDPVPSDTTPPEWVVSQPPNLYEGNTTGGYGGTIIEPTATDDSGEIPTITCTPDYPTVFPLGASTFTCTAKDASGNESGPASLTVTVLDTTPPAITCPADVAAKVGQAISLGTPSVSDIVDASPTVTNNAPAAYPPGATTVTWTAKDAKGNSAQCAQKVTLTYPWAGFSQPVDNVPVMNTAKAGQTVPLKWRLLDFTGAPVTDLSKVTVTVVSLSCQVGTSIDQIEEYASGASGLQNLGNGYYQWNWKTPASYANSCKTLKLNLGDGVLQTANFQFKK